MSSLRPYQTAAVDAARAAVLTGHRRVLIVSPTGSGKTHIAAHIIRSAVTLGGRALFLADRLELIDQASRKLDEAGLDHGVIMADHWRRRPGAPVQVASVPTLHRRSGLPPADVVICDEAHKSLSPTYRRIVEHYGAAVVLGLTATPYLYGGGGLGALYQHMVVVAQTPDLIRDGYLVPIETYAPSSPDLAGVRISHGDFQGDDLAAACDKPTLVGDIAATWHRVAQDRTTCVFATSKQHARHIQEELGIGWEYLDDSTPLSDRRGVSARIASGEAIGVCNVGILALGWDMPRVACVVMARPMRSKALYLQQVGRGTRPHPASGKDRMLLLDHAGNVWRHGLPEAPQEFGLDSEVTTQERTGAAGVRICRKCFGVSPAGADACRVCGEPYEVRERKLLFRSGRLEQYAAPAATLQARSAEIPLERRRRMYRDWQQQAIDRNYRPGYALAVFRNVFGRAPNAEELAP